MDTRRLNVRFFTIVMCFFAATIYNSSTVSCRSRDRSWPLFDSVVGVYAYLCVVVVGKSFERSILKFGDTGELDAR